MQVNLAREEIGENKDHRDHAVRTDSPEPPGLLDLAVNLDLMDSLVALDLR